MVSKSRPDKKKARRRYQNEVNRLQRELSRSIRVQGEIIGAKEKTIEELRKDYEQLRITLRDLGNDHSLKRCIPNHDGSLVSIGKVDAREIKIGVSGRYVNAVEKELVTKLADELVRLGYVRLETVDQRIYDGNITYTARIDVIPWYKTVSREMVYLDDDRIAMTYKEGELV